MLSAVVVGTGIGCQTHVPALRGAGFDVAALVGRDAARTAQRAARVGIPGACTSLTDALNRTDADAVVVTTPPNSHAELVLEAVAAGKHVVCEKPFARDKNEARQMLAAAQEAGVVHLVGTEYRADANRTQDNRSTLQVTGSGPTCGRSDGNAGNSRASSTSR